MNKYVVISVINREISTDFTDTLEKAQSIMKRIFKEYLDDEDLENSMGVDYGEDNYECWLTGNYNNVDIAIHEIP